MNKLDDLEKLNEQLQSAVFSGHPTVALEAAGLGHLIWPDSAWWTTQYGCTLRVVGRLAEAEAALRDAYPHRKYGRCRIEYTLGEICRDTCRLEEAEMWFRKATETDPSSTVPWVFLGAFLARQARFQEACEVLERGLQSEGDRDEVYFNLGKNRRTLGDFRGAKECFEAALAIDSRYRIAHEALRDITEAIRFREDLSSVSETVVARRKP